MKKIIGIVVAVIVVIALGFAGWLFLGRDPMSFAGGSTVAPEDYKGGDITGVPAQLASADLVKRGAYLIHAADCQACHTAPGSAPFAGGAASNCPTIEKRSCAQRSCTRDPPRSANGRPPELPAGRR